MSIASALMARQAKLPAAETHNVSVERDLRIPMPDGVVLLADHYAPQGLGDRPTILVRSVYTDRTKGGFVGRVIAERGFHVVIVSGRGVCGSGGRLTPFVCEHDDGLAVLAWLKKQPWFTGELGTTGTSYLGFTQWAIAAEAGPILQAMSTQATSSDFRSMLYPGDALSLEIFLGWLSMVHNQEKPMTAFLAAILNGANKRAAAARHLPLAEADTVATGAPAPYWREWLDHQSADDVWWSSSDHRHTVADVTAPNHLISGWRDFMLPALIRDYRTLHQAGRRPYLTIGPWHHWQTELSMTAMREGIAWLRAHLLKDHDGLRETPVRIYIQGAEEWRDLPVYPPAEARPQRWHLQGSGGLATTTPTESAPDRYRYDPADPTPAVLGMPRLMGSTRKSGEQVLAGRDDVLTYTGTPLPADLDVIGIPVAELSVTSSLAHTDFYVRLCDVAPSGKVTHVSEALRRITGDQPVDTLITIELWPTAHRFKQGHRIRVQVASGAFPRWDRNLGTGEPIATATAVRIADQQVHHRPTRPSAIVLPITPAT
jgi:putative CocE/NonD family hydrolase